MAQRRTRSVNGSDQGLSTKDRAIQIAMMLQKECNALLEQYKKRENLPEKTHDCLVEFRTLTSQLEAGDKLWVLHSALQHCHKLMVEAIVKEEEELGDGIMGMYESQRKIVKERLSHLIFNINQLLKAANGQNTSTLSFEVNAPKNLFDLKCWIHQVYKEVKHWTQTAIDVLKKVSSVNDNEEPRRIMRGIGVMRRHERRKGRERR
ncbi:ciliary neurotrophic factor [Pholidichthys leucotaenia]